MHLPGPPRLGTLKSPFRAGNAAFRPRAPCHASSVKPFELFNSVATRNDLVSVLQEDPELAQALHPATTAKATRHALARVVSLPKAEFRPRDTLPDKPGSLGMLVLEGLLLRGVCVAERPTLEIFGAGDLVRPFDGEHDPYAVVPAEVRWWALRPAKLALLDASFIRRMAEFPEVIGELAGRLGRVATASSVRLSIVQQPRLTVRLQLVLWQLADRFGRVQIDGVVLPLPLCHGLLAWLVGARRPAVSGALKELERGRLIARGPDETWWLARRTHDLLAELTDPAERIAA